MIPATDGSIQSNAYQNGLNVYAVERIMRLVLVGNHAQDARKEQTLFLRGAKYRKYQERTKETPTERGSMHTLQRGSRVLFSWYTMRKVREAKPCLCLLGTS